MSVELPDTFSDTLLTMLKDAITRCNMSLANCRGQAYDGTTNMQGIRNGVATQIQSKFPSAIRLYSLPSTLSAVSIPRGEA